MKEDYIKTRVDKAAANHFRELRLARQQTLDAIRATDMLGPTGSRETIRAFHKARLAEIEGRMSNPIVVEGLMSFDAWLESSGVEEKK